jgi:hypothetical protein
VGREVVLVTTKGKLQVLAKGTVTIPPPNRRTDWQRDKEGKMVHLTKSRLVIELSAGSVTIRSATLPYPLGREKTLGALADRLSARDTRVSSKPSPHIMWDLKGIRLPSRGSGAGDQHHPGKGQAEEATGEGIGGGTATEDDDGGDWDAGVDTVDRPLRELMVEEDNFVVNTAGGMEGGGEEGGDEEEGEEGELAAPECGGDHGPNVKLDVLHGMMRITRTLRKRHGAFMTFCRRLTDAMWVLDKEDLERIKAEKLKGGMTSEQWDDYFVQHWGEIRKRCRRYVPCPAVLVKRLQILESIYGDIPDAETKKPFFSKETWKRWKSLKEHAEKGCLTDPDPLLVALYYVVGQAKDGSDILSCSRGTSDLEVSGVIL